MRGLQTIGLVALSLQGASSAPALRDDMIAAINAQAPGWTAARNPRFDGLTLDQARRLLGVLSNTTQRSERSIGRTERARVGKVPDAFDTRTQWPDCVFPIRDQGHCGGCWAFSTAEVLSDRLCIASGGKIKVALSTEDLMSCWVSALYNHGCDGGVPEDAWKYTTTTGIVSEDCFPFTNASAKNGTTPTCEIGEKMCVGQQEYRKYKAQQGTVTTIIDAPWAAQQAMVDHGTLTASFTVYEDFLAYKSGVYKHVNGSALGKHSVKLVAYGIDNSTGVGVHYWTVANSWGPDWGEEGHFRIVMNTDESGIEDAIVYALADV